MRNTLKTICVLAVTAFVMLLFRALVLTVCCIEGDALQPDFLAGDRVLVNRWSYGLRVGGDGLLTYNRLWRATVGRGDIVAINDPTDTLQSAVGDRRVLFLRCKALPGDAPVLSSLGGGYVIPGRYSCADMDYYLMEPLAALSPSTGKSGEGLLIVPEDHIIGRAFLIIYSHDPSKPLWDGWRTDRFLAYP